MNWADEFDEPADGDAPRIEERDEGNGSQGRHRVPHQPRWQEDQNHTTSQEDARQDQGQPRVAERKTWTKFGQEKGKAAGPHSATTTIGENVILKMSAGNKTAEPEVDDMDKMRQQLANKRIVCRLCKGDHFTTKCPYKDTLEAIPGAAQTLPRLVRVP